MKLTTPDIHTFQRFMFRNGREQHQKKVTKTVAQKTTKSLVQQMNDGTYHQTCTLLPSAMEGCSNNTDSDDNEKSEPNSQQMLHLYRELMLEN